MEGAAPSERTEAWVAFDGSNVYVSARVWDSAPEIAWVANEMRRDAPSIELNDQFGVFLDTYYDRRNGVGFFVNPLGGFSDLQITNEEDANLDWNPITEIRAGRFDGGWTVEMAIPFRSLRYRSGRDQVWGIQMRRSIVRRNEWNHLTSPSSRSPWPGMDPRGRNAYRVTARSWESSRRLRVKTWRSNPMRSPVSKRT